MPRITGSKLVDRASRTIPQRLSSWPAALAAAWSARFAKARRSSRRGGVGKLRIGEPIGAVFFSLRELASLAQVIERAIVGGGRLGASFPARG